MLALFTNNGVSTYPSPSNKQKSPRYAVRGLFLSHVELPAPNRKLFTAWGPSGCITTVPLVVIQLYNTIIV